MLESQIEELTMAQSKAISEFESLKTQLVQHQNENGQLKASNEKFKLDVASLEEKLNSSDIDLKQTKEKLAENLKDYKGSIENLKQKYAPKITKLKKKLTNCSLVLSLIEKHVFHADGPMFADFLSSLGDKKATTDLDESTTAYELDEAKFSELIQKKGADLDKLSNYAKFEQDLKFLGENNTKLRTELDAAKHSLNMAESKLKEQKELVHQEHQKSVDELHLKLANLDLKHKQLLNEDNRESHAVKKKLIKLEEDCEKLKKENESLILKQQQDGETNEKSLSSMKQKAELRMASIKVIKFI